MPSSRAVPPEPCRCIALVGFMGAGKTTVARRLGNILGRTVFDLDDAIERHRGMSVQEIFAAHGEDYFRQMETRELEACLRSPDACVLAVGGGAIESEHNRSLLRSAAGVRTFYLEAPLAELLARCTPRHQDAPVRPLLADAERLFERRAGLYAAVGSPVSTFGFSAEQVAAHIVSLLQMDNALGA